jgi:hypothetical protein
MRVKHPAIGAIADTFVKQAEIDRTAVSDGTHQTENLPCGYDGIEHQVHAA